MTRLTVSAREAIVHKALDKRFQDQINETKSQENLLALKCYNAVFDEKTLKSVKAVPEKWFCMDGCLRFNIGGLDLRLSVTENMPVPYQRHCEKLGVITGELADEVTAFVHKKKDEQDNRSKIFRNLEALLASVNTFKQLSEVWPEGKAYYEDMIDKPKLQLPAIRFDEINAALGLDKAGE